MKVKILLDSIGQDGSAPRLTTWLLTMPRFILAELNTHRAFSRNCPSSRAIPLHKRIQIVEESPFIPMEWGLEKLGMQSSELADSETSLKASQVWKNASLDAIKWAKELDALGIHKQLTNRLLEPFVEVSDLVTSTREGFENFFSQRAEKLAEPHMRELAYAMLKEYNDSDPQILKRGEWHIPFGDKMYPNLSFQDQIKVAVARAARNSYDNFDGTFDLQKDLNLHDRLVNDGHWSSFEHVAQVPESEDFDRRLQGNLIGWIQLRKTYPNEYRKDRRVLD